MPEDRTTADEPMSTPNSGGLREAVARVRRFLDERERPTPFAPQGFLPVDFLGEITRTGDRLLASDLRALLAAHPEPVPTPDSEAGRLRQQRDAMQALAERNAEDAALWRAQFNRQHGASSGVWVNPDGTTQPVISSTLSAGPTFDDLLADPTQQLDEEGVVAASIPTPDSAADATVGEREAGLQARYRVQKINDPTGKHDDCGYFVLDPQHDPTARHALAEYARRTPINALRLDLMRWLSSGTVPAAPSADDDAVGDGRRATASRTGTPNRDSFRTVAEIGASRRTVAEINRIDQAGDRLRRTHAALLEAHDRGYALGLAARDADHTPPPADDANRAPVSGGLNEGERAALADLVWPSNYADPDLEAICEFIERILATRDAASKAEALREAADINDGSAPTFAAWLRDRADRIEAHP